MEAIQYLRALCVTVFALSLCSCARQTHRRTALNPIPSPSEFCNSEACSNSRGGRGQRNCRNVVCADKRRISGVWQSDLRRASRGGFREGGRSARAQNEKASVSARPEVVE